MRVSVFTTVLGGLFLGLLVGFPVQAMGKGSGRTKTQFKAFFDSESLSKNRLFMKLDVEAAVAQLPEAGSSSKNDEIGGMNLTVTVNATSVTEAVADNGRVNTAAFKARLTANGKILHVDLRGLDLPTLLGLTATDNGKGFSTTITVTVTVAAASQDGGAAPAETTLFAGDINLDYKQKADKLAKGKTAK